MAKGEEQGRAMPDCAGAEGEAIFWWNSTETFAASLSLVRNKLREEEGVDLGTTVDAAS
jgi:hypothetical protein